MMPYRFAPCFRQTSAAIALLCTVSACNGSLTPELMPLAPGGARPTVDDVIAHVACEVGKGMVTHGVDPKNTRPGSGFPGNAPPSDQQLWLNLVNFNYVAVISLQLEVTNNEGFNPSFNFINPLAPYAIPSATSMPQQFTSGSVALAIGAQLDGSQDRLFSFTYNMDFARLFHYLDDLENEWKSVTNNGEHPENWEKTAHKVREMISTAHPETKIISVQRGDDGTPELKFNCEAGTGLSGNIGLEEIISDGLWATEQSRTWNVYNYPDANLASQPVEIVPGAARPEEVLERAPFLLKPQFKSLFGEQKRVVKPGPHPLNTPPPPPPEPPKGQGPTLNAQAPTTFSSRTAFTVQEGINGGPNWTLRHFVGPSASGGGSGGGGAAAKGGGGGASGSSSGAGGSGSASQGLINLNRTAVDTLTLVAGATCYGERKGAVSGDPADPSHKADHNSHDYWSALPSCGSANSQTSNTVESIYEQLLLTPR
jgi:hypothetical protein